MSVIHSLQAVMNLMTCSVVACIVFSCRFLNRRWGYAGLCFTTERHKRETSVCARQFAGRSGGHVCGKSSVLRWSHCWSAAREHFHVYTWHGSLALRCKPAEIPASVGFQWAGRQYILATEGLDIVFDRLNAQCVFSSNLRECVY